MKIKSAILIGLMLLMSSFVFAYDIGEIYTQEQIDAIDMDTINLGISWSVINNGFYLDGNMIKRAFTYKGLQPLPDETYEVVGRVATIPTDYYSFYTLCRTSYVISDCNTYFLILSERGKYFKTLSIRTSLKNLQTPDEQSIDIS